VFDYNRTVNSFINPFTDESDELLNLVTKAVMPDTVTKDLCRQSALGQQLFDDLVSKRINTNNVNQRRNVSCTHGKPQESVLRFDWVKK
jgi:hypothetical protein